MFERYVDNISGHGDQKTGLCPFHDDNNSSFSFNTDSGLWTCFAGCGSGNAYQFAVRNGIDPIPYRNEGTFMASGIVNPVKQKNMPAILPAIDFARKAKGYHKYLIDHWDKLPIPKGWTIPGVRALMVGYDYGKSRFTFPNFNEDGNLLNIKYHKGPNDEKPFSIKHFGANRLYPLDILVKAYRPDDNLFYCAGEKDCCTIVSLGLQAVTNTTGELSKLPPDINLLTGYKLITIVYDNDSTGQRGAKNIAELLLNEFPHTKIKLFTGRY